MTDKAANLALKGFMAENPKASAMDIFEFVRNEVLGFPGFTDEIIKRLIDLQKEHKSLVELVRSILRSRPIPPITWPAHSTPFPPSEITCSPDTKTGK